MNDPEALIRARGLRKEYGSNEGLVRAVDGIDLDVATGETVPVMGPSGCGKSTLLHLLGGLDRPSGGELSLEGRRLDQMGEKALARFRRSAVGFVFQAFHLMDELTAQGRTSSCPRSWPATHPKRPVAAPRSCSTRSAWRTGRTTCRRRSLVASASA